MTTTTLRKIDAMHHYYGVGVGRCGNCPHLRSKTFGHVYHKCLVYGDTAGEGTDWRMKYQACGLIDKPFPEEDVRIMKLVRMAGTPEPQLPGQMRMDI